MFRTPQDLYDTATKYVKALPTNVEDAKALAEKVKKVVEVEQEKVKTVVSTYNKAQRGDASINEIVAANKKAQDLMVSARFAAFMAMPGAIFALPFAIEASKEYDFDFLPASVEKEFDL
jgi:hypothetical protein